MTGLHKRIRKLYRKRNAVVIRHYRWQQDIAAELAAVDAEIDAAEELAYGLNKARKRFVRVLANRWRELAVARARAVLARFANIRLYSQDRRND